MQIMKWEDINENTSEISTFEILGKNLKELANEYLIKAEALYGIRSKLLPFNDGKLFISAKGHSYVKPRVTTTSYTEIEKEQVPNDIYIARELLKVEESTINDLAHEIIHILSGTDGKGTIDLEEGLACYFAILCVEEEFGKQDSSMWDDYFKKDETGNYGRAYNNVVRLISDYDEHAIKKLRSCVNGTTILLNEDCFKVMACLDKIPDDDLINELLGYSIKNAHEKQ